MDNDEGTRRVVGDRRGSARDSMTFQRRAKIRLSKEHLHRLLELDEDEFVVNIGTEFDPTSVSVVIESPRFPLVPDDTESPIVQTVITQHDCGHLTYEYQAPEQCSHGYDPMLCGMH